MGRALTGHPIAAPTKCPACGSEVEKEADTPYIRCLNPACPAQLKERLRWFCGRGQMDIEGLGDVLVDPPILQAPMAGFTNYAFRQIVREFGGVGLQATEMISARSFVWLDQHQAEHPDRLWGIKSESRPLAVQI